MYMDRIDIDRLDKQSEFCIYFVSKMINEMLYWVFRYLRELSSHLLPPEEHARFYNMQRQLSHSGDVE